MCTLCRDFNLKIHALSVALIKLFYFIFKACVMLTTFAGFVGGLSPELTVVCDQSLRVLFSVFLLCKVHASS